MRKKFERYSSYHSSESNNRKTVGVTIRPELLAQARDMKINISKTLEKSLEQIIEAQNNRFLGEASLGKEGSMEPRAGFDPATNSLQGCRSTGLSHRGTVALTGFVK